jgi:hypothetical protein
LNWPTKSFDPSDPILKCIDALSHIHITDISMTANNACVLGMDRRYDRPSEKVKVMGCIPAFMLRSQLIHETTIKAVKSSLLTRKLSLSSKRIIVDDRSEDGKGQFRASQASFEPFKTSNDFRTTEKSESFGVTWGGFSKKSPMYQTNQSDASCQKSIKSKKSKDKEFNFRSASRAVDYIMDRCTKSNFNKTFASTFKSETSYEDILESAKIASIYKSPFDNTSSGRDEEMILQNISDTILRNPESAALHENFARMHPSQLFKSQGINQKRIYLDLIKQGNIDQIQTEIMKKLLFENKQSPKHLNKDSNSALSGSKIKAHHGLPKTPQTVSAALIRTQNKKATDTIKRMTKEVRYAIKDARDLTDAIREARSRDKHTKPAVIKQKVNELAKISNIKLLAKKMSLPSVITYTPRSDILNMHDLKIEPNPKATDSPINDKPAHQHNPYQLFNTKSMPVSKHYDAPSFSIISEVSDSPRIYTPAILDHDIIPEKQEKLAKIDFRAHNIRTEKMLDKDAKQTFEARRQQAIEIKAKHRITKIAKTKTEIEVRDNRYVVRIEKLKKNKHQRPIMKQWIALIGSYFLLEALDTLRISILYGLT